MADISTLNGYNLKDAVARQALHGHDVYADVPLDAVFTDTNTTYAISLSGNVLTLTGSDGSTSTATFIDADTTGY